MKKNNLWMPCLTVCLVFITAGSACAGAWTREKGKSYHRMAVSYYDADEEYDAEGASRSMNLTGEFSDFNLNYYMEYGILDQLTVMASVYYKMLEREDDDYKYDTYGMGDADLGARYRLHDSNIGIFSLQGMIKIPEFYDEDDTLPLGNGQYDYELRLLYGRSLWPVIPGYVNLEAGYRLRDKAPSDEFRYLAEIGSELGKNFYTRAKLDALVSMNNADESTDDFENPASALEYDLGKLDLTLGYHITEALGLELGYTPALWGKNTAKGAAWSFAVSFQPGK
jgi:protein XagA